MQRFQLRAVLVLSIVLAVAGCDDAQPPEVSQRFRVRVVVQGSSNAEREAQVEAVVGRLDRELGLDSAATAVTSVTEQRRVLRELAAQGVELVVSLGSGLGRQAGAESPAHPYTAFVSEVGLPREPNLAVMTFQMDGAAYLAGVAAALVGGSKVGVVVGEEQNPSSSVVTSFRQGFESRYPYGRLQVVVGPDGVHSLARDRVKVAFFAGDALDPGIVAAAETNDIDLIGIGGGGLTRYPATMLAAIEVDLGEAIVRITHDVLDDTFSGRSYVFDLGSGIVDLKLTPRFVALAGDGAGEALDEARAAVNAGMVEVEGMGL